MGVYSDLDWQGPGGVACSSRRSERGTLLARLRGRYSELDWWGVGGVACSSRRSERVTVLGVSLGTLRWGELLRARVREALLLGRVQRLRVRERVARVLGQ